MKLRTHFRAGVFLLLFGSVAAHAQRNDAAFWNSPDKEEKDAKGKVTYSEKRDKATNTIHVFQRGHSYVYRYDPQSQYIVSADTGDSSEDYRYDNAGRLTAITVHAGSLAFSVSQTNDGKIQTNGLPAIFVQKGRGARDESIVTEKGSSIASVHYHPAGYVQRISISDDEYQLNLRKQGNGSTFTQVLTGRNGKKITEATVDGNKVARSFAFCLDPIAKALGVTETWANDVIVSQNTLKTLSTIRPRDGGDVIAYILELNDTRVGFDSTGKPLFYDVKLNFVDATPQSTDTDVVSSVTTEMTAVAPSRIVYTYDGAVAAYGEEVAAGAIASFWSSADEDGKRRVRFRQLDSKPTLPTTAPSSSTLAAPSLAGRHGRMQTNTFYLCDASSVCTYGEGIPASCTWTYYYCDDSSTSSGYPATKSGGGGGGTTGGNRVTGDAKLTMAVNNAFTTAAKKMDENPTCKDILNLTDANGVTLGSNLQTRGNGLTFNQWMETKLRWVNGYTNGLCDGSNAAWTTINGTTVNVCTVFQNLGSSAAANRAMHEALHTLGLTEAPKDPSAMTSAQINNFVGSKCGGF